MKYIVTCFRPFSLADSDGFKDLAKKLVAIRATYGKIDDISQILPCATTVSRHLDNTVTTSKSTLKQVFQTFSYHFVSFFTDLRSFYRCKKDIGQSCLILATVLQFALSK
jgi:hypothetical protein